MVELIKNPSDQPRPAVIQRPDAENPFGFRQPAVIGIASRRPFVLPDLIVPSAVNDASKQAEKCRTGEYRGYGV